MSDNGDVALTSSYERGLEVMRQMWGETPEEMLASIETDFNRDVYRLIISSCFGEVWSNDTLSPKLRSLITVAIVATLGRTSETELHVLWARRNGCSADELREVIKHVTAYAGAPLGGDAVMAAGRVLAAETATE